MATFMALAALAPAWAQSGAALSESAPAEAAATTPRPEAVERDALLARAADPSQLKGGAVASVKTITVPLGGSVRYDNEAVWKRLVELAGGAGSRFAVFGTASVFPDRVASRIMQALERHGALADYVEVAPGLKETDSGQAVRDPRWIELIHRAQGVVFSGGSQDRITSTLQPNGHETPLLAALRALHRRGGVVAGTSAGAAMMSTVMFRDAQDVLGVLKGRMRPGREIDQGLGFVGSDLFVDQHFLKRGRIGRIIPLMLDQGYRLGLGVEEDSGAVVHGDVIEVIGSRGVVVVDLSEAQSSRRSSALVMEGARLSYLEPGDRYHMATRTVLPAALRAQTPISTIAPGFEPYFPRERFFMDMLGDHTIANAMIHVVEGSRSVIRGLAYSPSPSPLDAEPDLGFEFRLTRDDRTRGWVSYSTGADSYTLADVRLDILPVKVSRPLYTPWPLKP